MNHGTLQSRIIEEIKQRLNPNISLVDELAELLRISKDSAYRRIRGEKILDLNELKILATHYEFSLDEHFSLVSNGTGLRYQVVGSENYSFEEYLNVTLARVQELNKIEDSFISYLARDMPIVYWYRFDKLAAFKILYWHKFWLKDPNYAKVSFDFDHLPKKIQS